MSKKIGEIKLFGLFSIIVLGLYQSAWLNIMLESTLQNIGSIRKVDASIYFYIALLLFSLCIVIAALYYLTKHKKSVIKYSLIAILLATILFSGVKYMYPFFYYFLSHYYVGVYQWQQTASFIALFFIGSCIVWCSIKSISIIKVALYGFIVGCTIWAIISGLLVFSGIYYSWWTTIIGVLAVLAIICIIKKPKLPNSKKIVQFILSAVIFINISIILGKLNLGRLSGDSHQYLDYGNALAVYGGLAKAEIGGAFSGARAIFLPALNALGKMFGFVETNTFVVFLYINFLAVFANELKSQLNENGLVKNLFLPISIAILMLVSSPSIVTVGIWHMSNGPTMVIMFMVAITLNMCTKSDDTGYAILTSILMSGLLFTRVEMSLFCMMLLAFISSQSISKKQMAILFCVPFAVLAIYYGGFFIQYGLDVKTMFLNFERASIIIGLYIAFGIYLITIWRKYLLKLQKLIVPIMLSAMVAVLIITTILDYEKLVSNMIAINWHLFFADYSGYQWHIMIGLLPLIYLLMKKNKNVKVAPSIIFVIISFALFIIDLFMFRYKPSRFGDSDSGYRMITQLYPFVVFAVMAKISPILCYSRNKRKASDENTLENQKVT